VKTDQQWRKLFTFREQESDNLRPEKDIVVRTYSYLELSDEK